MNQGDDEEREETFNRITALLVETDRAAHALRDDFLVYLVGIALLHVAEERVQTVGPPVRRMVS